MGALRWDIFGRVIDNYGDVGVCWRLASQLAARGDTVRLVLDDHAALAWMAPGGTCGGVELLHWPGPALPGDVVVEAFGCDPPHEFIAAMRAAAPAPVWINLEYLSAEGYVERMHGLPSPQPGGQIKWFFYPGFDDATGGLIREPGLAAAQQAFDAAAWLHARGWAPRPGERCASLFCYDTAPVAALLPLLARQPTLLLLTPGPAQRLAHAVAPLPGLRCVDLPWLAQPDYDRLLWACDLNLVRGEDSFVRAQFAARPLVWQAYRQEDRAHFAKLDAFLDLYCAGMPPGLADTTRALWHAWNEEAGVGSLWPAYAGRLAELNAHARRWCADLATQPDIASKLMIFCEKVREKG